MTEHTPTPWEIGACGTSIRAGEGGEIHIGSTHAGHGTFYSVQANAAFIVRAVNNHERLLTALRQIQETAEHDIQRGIVPDDSIVWQIEADARAAIAAAEHPV